MGGYASERAAIEKRVKDNWSTTPIVFDNVGFRPADSNYVSVAILNASANQLEINGASPKHRYTGIISIQIFTDANSGTQTARTYADTIAAIFRNQSFSHSDSGTITCRTPNAIRAGVVDGRYQLNLTVPYYRDTAT